MPYVAIKLWPKGEEAKARLADNVSKTVQETLGCPPEAITLSIEEISRDDWDEKVVKPEIEPYQDAMMILSGQKRY